MDQTSKVRRVVVIDDNRGFRLAAEAFLRTLPEVEFAGAAPDGKQGMELVSRTRPDAAIVDIAMPCMNGFELATYLRAQPDAPGIILVSLNVDQAVRCEALRIGVDAVLPKVDFVAQLPALLDSIFVERNGCADA